MRHRLTSVLVALTIATTSLSGCGTQPEKPRESSATSTALTGSITFQTWSLKNDKFTGYFENLVKSFEAKNPGTKINWVDQPGEGYEDKVLQQANAGQLPDVINLPQDFAFQLAKVKKLADLEKLDAQGLKDYVPGGLSAYKFDGISGSYGYPWYLGTDLNWWNKKAFAEAGLPTDKFPTTFEELYTAAKTIAQKSGGKMPLISSMPGLDAFSSAGIETFKDGKFTFNDPKAVDLVAKYAELYKLKAAPAEMLNNDYAGNAKLYIQGKVAWTTGSSGFPGDLQKEAPTLVKDTVATPRIGNPPLFVQGISVSAESKNPALALAFAKFATNNTNQVEFVKIAQGFLPGTVEANAHPESYTAAITDPLKAEALKIAAAAMPKAKIANPIQYNNDMDKFVKQQIALAIKGDISAKDALDKAVKYCNDTLKN